MSTFEWVIAGYLIAGLIYAATVYHAITDEKVREEVEKHAEPMPPEIFRVLFPVVTAVLLTGIVLAWPPALAWETIGRFRQR